jgi:hypothetical protein
MNSLQYWFLDAAIESCIAISWIIPDSNGEIAINRMPLSIGWNEMTDVISSLFCSGYIMAIEPYKLGELQESFCQKNDLLTVDCLLKKGFIPSHDQIKQSLIQFHNNGIYDESNFYYFLTPLGGKEWELNSTLSWHKYIVFRGGFEETSIACYDRNIITQYIDYHHLLKYSNHNIYVPILSSQSWEEIKPFHCTYWKKLSIGYRVSYQVECLNVQNRSFDENIILLEQRKEAMDWYHNLRKWYTHHFDY